MSGPQETVNPQMLQHMALINSLSLKAYNSKSRQALIFAILNDTIHAIRYDRAVLFDESNTRKPKLLGVSGQVEVSNDARLSKQWLEIVSDLKDPMKPQVVTDESLQKEQDLWKTLQEETKAAILWLPIVHEDELVLGLMLEIFGTIKDTSKVNETLKFLTTYLTPAYGSAWRKLTPKFSFKAKRLGKAQILIALAGIFLFLILIRVPLRVSAPCEVVADNPILVTAPLEGIISQVNVSPGDIVKKGDILVDYDDRVPMRNLEVAKKDVEILDAEVNRARTLGLSDTKSRTELGVLELKLEKEKVNLDLVKWQASQLVIHAPASGVVMIDNPDAWRGKPVRVGEKILTINNPHDTKIRIWIPEDDNIVLDSTKPIKIFLNIDPKISYDAHLIFVADESTISDVKLPSFQAEAKWSKEPQHIKLGLKGVAILYGEKVTLFYYLARKPWAALRRILGS